MARARNRTKDQPDPKDFIGCYIRQLPSHLLVESARIAVEENPANHPPVHALVAIMATALVGDGKDGEELSPIQRVAVLTSKYWGAKGVKLGVYFMDTADSSLKNRILSHMNAWGQQGRANVVFQEASAGVAQVRIARQASGYWSYLGVDILSIPRGEQTLNLQQFTMSTPESEYLRVVRHETGHTLGAPHEHMRSEIIKRLDPAKTIAYFKQFQGWSAEETRQQVLTPVNEASLLVPTPADEESIMAYQLPGSITKDGRPVVGGSDINQRDADYVARIYPGSAGPVGPEPPPTGGNKYTLDGVVTVTGAQLRGTVTIDDGGRAGLAGTLTVTAGAFVGDVKGGT
jgi:hypothetical protein